MPAPLAPVLDRWPDALLPEAPGRLVVPPGMRAILLAAVARTTGRPVLAIVPGEGEAERLGDDVALFTDDVLHLPAWETLPFEHVSPSITTMGARVAARAALREGRPVVVTASARAAAQRVSPTRVDPVVVRVGEEHPFEVLVDLLGALGYRRTDRVEARGEMAVRGGIVDLYPPQEVRPLRLDFWGDTLEEIRVFDVATQRSHGVRDHLVAHPAREVLLDEALRRRAAELRDRESWAVATWDRIAEGVTFPGVESWIPWLAPSRTVLDETDALTVVFDPVGVSGRLEELRREEADLAIALGDTWGDEAPADRPALYLPLDVEGALEAPSVPAGPADERLEVAGLDAVPGDPDSVAAAVNRLTADGVAVVIAMDGETAARRVAGLLAEAGCDLPVVDRLGGVDAAIVPEGIHHGFVSRALGVAVIGEREVAGRRRARRRRRGPGEGREAAYRDLRPGDHVVHHHHGIGRFLGLVERSFAGSSRDYLLIEYAGGDRLYVPSDQLAAIRPYTGGEQPRLSRMGGGDWAQTRGRVRKAVVAVAQRVVDLHRTRRVAEGHAFPPDTPWQTEFEAGFPYEETPDQLRAVEEVKADMEAPAPMDRLVFGDVGYGKTEVALRAAFKAVQDGRQVAVLVPTTLLAQQHHATFRERFAPFPVRVEMLSRFLSPARQREVLGGLAAGTVDIVVGTHRLLADDVRFRDLGLVVVDEEQRFGVNAKDRLKELRTSVDVLTLTATPIPRTLEMALTGIRPVSHIRTPPQDRRPILTFVGPYDERTVAAAIRRELLREGQVFYVHNRVRSIDHAVDRLRTLVPDARYAVAHGRMSDAELEQVMYGFWNRESDVLVATTIIESGLDLPQVNTLIVERADRLGLAQLYQLRGRVGRGRHRAYAYLFHPPEERLGEDARRRLEAIGDLTDLGSGFRLAMRDLEIRGAGSILGEVQSGHIAAVGFDLYAELVAEAVAEMEGREPAPEPSEVRIELPVDARLPESYVPDPDGRLEAYRRLAAATTAEGVDEVVAEWEDRYGPLPDEARALIDVARLRVEALRVGLAEIVAMRREVRLSPVTLRPSQEVRLQRIAGDAVVRGEALFLPLDGGRPAAHLTEFLHRMWPPVT